MAETLAISRIQAKTQARKPFLHRFRADALLDGHCKKQATMVDFWMMHGWYKKKGGSIRLKHAEWQGSPGTREAAIRFLIDKVLRIDPRDVIQKHFNSNRLGAMLATYYGHVFEAVKAAGYDVLVWEMKSVPDFFFDKIENRIEATNWLVQKLKKDPHSITCKDFNDNCLGGMLAEFHGNSPNSALREAGCDVPPEEMDNCPKSFHDSRENRIMIIRKIAEDMRNKGIKPRDIIRRNIIASGYGTVLKYYHNSPFEALFDAGCVTKADEDYMRRHGSGRFVKN